MGEGKQCSKAQSGVCPLLPAALHPSDHWVELLEHAGRYWAEHQFSRPITVIITLEQWLMSRKLGRFDVAPICLWRIWSYGLHWLCSDGHVTYSTVCTIILCLSLWMRKVWKTSRCILVEMANKICCRMDIYETEESTLPFMSYLPEMPTEHAVVWSAWPSSVFSCTLTVTILLYQFSE